MLVDDIHKPVAPEGVITLEVSPVHMPELHPSYPGILGPDVFDVFQRKGIPCRLGQDP